MKNLICSIFLLLVFLSSAQLLIDKETPTNNSVILEFGSDGDKGIVLPRITDAGFYNSYLSPGGLYLSAIGNENYVYFGQVMVKLPSYGAMSLTPRKIKNDKRFDPNENGYNTVRLKDNNNPQSFIVGANSSTRFGALVLESTSKAMVLPIVNKYSDIGSPEPGTIAYDKTHKVLVVFDGEKWAFWGK